MLEARLYSEKNKKEWNDFIADSKNGTFMLNRGYMEYHSDRFNDASLMFYEDGKLIALLPASRHEDELRSHGGLTYGGIISNRKMNTLKMLAVFDALKNFLKENKISRLIYKRVPSIYYTYPADEDLYALFRNGAKLVRRDLSTTIYMPDKINFSKGKKWGVSRAKQANLKVKKFDDFDLFIEKENEVLMKAHNVKAVHSADELKYLAGLFPENIALYGTFSDNEFLAGTVIFETPTVAHTQYISNTDKGRELFAFDFLMYQLVTEVYNQKQYFDFGISTENNGTLLNEGLCQQKETFGGRASVYDFYEWSVK